MSQKSVGIGLAGEKPKSYHGKKTTTVQMHKMLGWTSGEKIFETDEFRRKNTFTHKHTQKRKINKELKK